MIDSTESADEEGAEVVLGGERATRRRPRDYDARFWLRPLPKKEGDPCDVHTVAFPWAEKLRDVWRPMATLDREHDAIYENRKLRRGGQMHPAMQRLEMSGFDSTRLFVTTSIVDTFTARMAARRTKTAFVVDDAEWSLKQRAQDFRRWLDGKQRDVAFDALYPEIINDACVRGDGVVYIDDADDDVFAERVHRSELLIDPYEARQGAAAVRTMYRMRAVSRDSLIAMFPGHADAIMSAPDAESRAHDSMTADWLANEADVSRRDVVDLVEAWHLPSGDCDDEDDPNDGRKFAGLVNVTLCYREWRTPRFPFARLSRHKSKRGYWARGDVEALRGLQAMINRMIDDIAMNVAVTGKGVWITPPGIEPAQLVGYRPFMLTAPGGAGGRMEFYHPAPVGPATLDLLERCIAKAHDLTGAAQWFAQGRSPLGNGVSGVALDTAEDQLSARHSVFEQQCATFAVDTSQAFIDAAQRIARRMKDGEKGERRRMKAATWLDKGTLQRIEWDDVSMEGNEYRLQAEPISAIPSTRGGKLAWISEMIAKGVIPSSQAATLYDEPDVAHANRVQLGAMKNVERMMDELGRPDRYPIPPTPEEWHDLDLCVVYAKAYYNRAQAERAPEDVEVRYREFGDAAIALQSRAKAPPPDAAMPPPGMEPPAMPGGMPPPMIDPAAAQASAAPPMPAM